MPRAKTEAGGELETIMSECDYLWCATFARICRFVETFLDTRSEIEFHYDQKESEVLYCRIHHHDHIEIV